MRLAHALCALAVAGAGAGAWADAASAPAPAPATGARAPTAPTAPMMDSAACRAALQALQQEEARLAQRPAASVPGVWPALRERAARACLGGPAGRPPPAAQAPVPAYPPAPSPRVALPAPQARLPPAPVVAPGSGLPLTVIACDATGCTASDGSRLTHNGPHLVGPRGACTLEGAVLRCPP